jgi:hypothetical protein
MGRIISLYGKAVGEIRLVNIPRADEFLALTDSCHIGILGLAGPDIDPAEGVRWLSATWSRQSRFPLGQAVAAFAIELFARLLFKAV